MFFDLLSKLEIKYEDDDYKIFQQSIIDKYNMEEIQIDMNDELNDIKLLQCKYVNLSIPDFAIEYESDLLRGNKYSVSNPTLNAATKRIETKEDLLNRYFQFKSVFENSLSYAEKVVFIDFFILRKGREPIKERLRVGNERFKVIKSSCLIKFALALDFESIIEIKSTNTSI